ncbi:GNAT family N-acetyltransferase [Pedobacter arcticus]|uniref:GNAT family N-acetyltransferase n=1 Tax=Pedobacter arcticus TaxID=752140 RepID=UPI000307AC74|nr:GNAT family N-acetyltransferase [Pedobacter arcticus]
MDEIEDWLIEERDKTGEGFYCNWNVIKSSYNKNELVIITYKNKTIGFITWSLLTDKTARIEIAEVKPTYRKKGFGKNLLTALLKFLKSKGINVVELRCSPKTSEPIWKSLGFIEFPDPPKNYNFDSLQSKKLYTILRDHCQISDITLADETIELWNEEPHTIDENTQATYLWNIEFIEGTKKLTKPIIHPAHYDWRLRWVIKGKIIKDCKLPEIQTN